MQLDMHYYGTWVMARAAGLSAETATTIAKAAQFVDDNAHQEAARFKDGGRVDVQATAHHATDLENLAEDDQRRVWVPFHFFPGNQGETYEERLLCRKDSELAQAMVLRNLEKAETCPYGIELMGITAHVYADTFSHYDFSGISSDQNAVDNRSIRIHRVGKEEQTRVLGKAKAFFKRQLDKVAGEIAEDLSRSLGHGAVATYPDRPYLDWEYVYEKRGSKAVVRRNNPETFLEGCKALHRMFRTFARTKPALADHEAKSFDDIEETVAGVLAVQKETKGRIQAWQDAVANTDIVPDDAIPAYDEKQLLAEFKRYNGVADSTAILDTFTFRFFQAASDHRNHVLRELMPTHSLLID